MNKRQVTEANHTELSQVELSRKNKLQLAKRVYSLCAFYHPGLNLLAIALIDKEIKIYKLKQNGSKVMITEHFSF